MIAAAIWPPGMADLVEALRGELDAGAVLQGGDIPDRYLSDLSDLPPVAPLLLVRPRSTGQVRAILRLASQYRVPVVPQGGLTGLAGGAMPLCGGIALSLDRMNAIEHVDPVTRTLTSQAGATIQQVQCAAIDHGMRFGVDFGARGSAQVGGAVSTNAGGNGVLQFGMMREQVLGLEVVLADGTLLPMLRPMLKNNTGYDLKHLFIGAEGTLGVITRALLKLHPPPRGQATALVALAGYEAALALLSRLQSRLTVAAFELMWRDFVDAALDWQQGRDPFETRHPLLVVANVEGSDDASVRGELEEALADAMGQGEVVDAAIAQTRSQASSFWRIREATAAFPARLHPPINFDVSLPMAKIGAFADACREALTTRWPQHRSLFFGHIGDSNLHVTVDGGTVPDEHAVHQMVYELVGRFAGSVSAEHGIGLHKKAWLGVSRSDAEIATMRAVKSAVDPLGLLNPGKVFEPR